MRTTTKLSLLWLFLAAAPSTAQDLKGLLAPLINRHRGEVSVAVKHLATGQSFSHRADQPMPTASLIKLPIMIEAYRQAEAGTIDLDLTITLAQADKVPGSGVLTPHFSAGTQLSLRDAVHLMMTVSDNTATNLVIDRIGLRATTDTMERMGCANTKLHSKLFRRGTSIFPERSKQFGIGSTTANEILTLLEKLHASKVVSKKASEAMLGHMLACTDKDKFPRFLPPGTKLAHKTGSVSSVRCDGGIIYAPGGAVAVCVLTKNNRDQRWVRDNAGNRLCARIAITAYRHFSPKGVMTSNAAPLDMGASGRLVEGLQRTLNARLDPSPNLDVDGDFGTATQKAVIELQQKRKLKATGIVDADTWKALGALVMTAKPVPPPGVVNAQTLETAQADPLDGPPVVTCKAWAIADGKTGKPLWGKNEAQRLDVASTTKIMTAYIVCELARKNPAVLDEVVTFSERADQTPGSTSGVRAGEKLTVRELLYGLLLPSGNDASVALAEHFGGRLKLATGSTDAKEQDPMHRFIAKMNSVARELGMKRTTYHNTHGLTARGHQSTADDLLRLAHTALQSSLFSKYVSTRQRGCRLVAAAGYQRDVVWRNTNQLLAIDGYIGVKTGTTRAAGACLVSGCARGGDKLLMVVLGSVGSATRYADSRNLYRWAWLQRQR